MVTFYNYYYNHVNAWNLLGGVVVRTLDLRPSVAGSFPSHDTAWLFLRQVHLISRVNYLGI